MKNYFDIKDKVAVVTGASSGLGWQIAQAYASQGAKQHYSLEEKKDYLKTLLKLKKNSELK